MTACSASPNTRPPSETMTLWIQSINQVQNDLQQVEAYLDCKEKKAAEGQSLLLCKRDSAIAKWLRSDALHVVQTVMWQWKLVSEQERQRSTFENHERQVALDAMRYEERLSVLQHEIDTVRGSTAKTRASTEFQLNELRSERRKTLERIETLAALVQRMNVATSTIAHLRAATAELTGPEKLALDCAECAEHGCRDAHIISLAKSALGHLLTDAGAPGASGANDAESCGESQETFASIPTSRASSKEVPDVQQRHSYKIAFPMPSSILLSPHTSRASSKEVPDQQQRHSYKIVPHPHSQERDSHTESLWQRQHGLPQHPSAIPTSTASEALPIKGVEPLVSHQAGTELRIKHRVLPPQPMPSSHPSCAVNSRCSVSTSASTPPQPETVISYRAPVIRPLDASMPPPCPTPTRQSLNGSHGAAPAVRKSMVASSAPPQAEMLPAARAWCTLPSSEATISSTPPTKSDATGRPVEFVVPAGTRPRDYSPFTPGLQMAFAGTTPPRMHVGAE